MERSFIMTYRIGRFLTNSVQTSLLTVLATLLLLLPLASIVGQQTDSTLTVRVVTTEGAVFPDVDVTLTNLDTGEVKNQRTTVTGESKFTNLLPGRYRATSTVRGFTVAATEF